MNTYYIGVDNGGTLSKAALFDQKGNQIASASISIAMLTPHEGWTERDMETLWDATATVIKQTIEKSNIAPSQIKAVACTGHGKGLYLWGKDDKPCGNGIISTDTRAYEYANRWMANGTGDEVFKKTYQKILACQPVSLLGWMKDNDPKRYENIKYIFEVKDYIRFRLTRVAQAELTDISGTNLLNLETKTYDDQLLDIFNISEIKDALPPLTRSFDKCGVVTKEAAAKTGLLEGTIVAGGMFDIDASAIAMDITNDENIAVIAGTWSINEYISKKPVLDKSIMMNSLYCLDDYYLIEESSPTSASNHAWFVNNFLEKERLEAKERGMHPYAYCDSLAANVAPDEQHIMFLPFLYGSNYNASAKASLIGLSSHHTKAHIIRSVLEGIVFTHKIHIDKLLKNRESTKSIRLAGGVTASTLWTQIFADITNIPIEVVKEGELGALGAAMGAAVACGTYSSLEEASANMVHVHTTVEPNKGYQGIYQEKYEEFTEVVAALAPIWK
jgi:L-xylulokinase